VAEEREACPSVHLAHELLGFRVHAFGAAVVERGVRAAVTAALSWSSPRVKECRWGRSGQFADHRAELGREPDRPALIALQHLGDLLMEGPAPAFEVLAAQAPQACHDGHFAGVDRHIRHRPLVPRMHPSRNRPAVRTRHRRFLSLRSNQHTFCLVDDFLDDQSRQSRNDYRRDIVAVTPDPSSPITLRDHRKCDRANFLTLPSTN
jgi:hypothetical protein